MVAMSREFFVQSGIPIQLNPAISRTNKCSMHRNPTTCRLNSRKWPPSNLEQPQIAHLESNPQGVYIMLCAVFNLCYV